MRTDYFAGLRVPTVPTTKIESGDAENLALARLSPLSPPSPQENSNPEGCAPLAGQTPPAALPWPAELRDIARRVADHFEWTAADRRDFVAWARRSPEALARAGEFLRAEVAKLPPPGVIERRRAVLAMLASDPALRVAWTCADDGESDPVLLTLAVRGKGACELAIPRARFDAFALLREVERHGSLTPNNHHPRRAP